METIYYSIRINKENEETMTKINDIFGIHSNSKDIWMYELVQKEEDDYIDFINIFTSILNDKMYLLEDIGVHKDDISIWMLCDFEDQCNLEFSASQIQKLSQIGVGLNISCY